jgi:transposase
MAKPCSLELRERVVNAVESGGSRREAADWFDVSPSSAIKWMQRRQATGSIAPKPSGGSISPLEAHAAFLFALIARRPDLTLDEIVVAMHKRRIAGSRSAVWRFFQRHKISFKKSLQAAEQERAHVARARRRWMREQGMFAEAGKAYLRAFEIFVTYEDPNAEGPLRNLARSWANGTGL